MTAPLELSIVMPCLDEAETLAACIRDAQAFLARRELQGEVLVADNGSTDDSVAIAESLGARVVHAPVRGYGAALLAGIRSAHGRYIIMGDADRSYDFTRLDGFLDTLRGGADLVMGNRFRGGIAAGAMPFLHRYLGNPVLSFIGRLFFSIPVGDFHCGLRGFRRDRMQSVGLSMPGMEFASEMVVRTALAGHTIAEVPTTLSPDGRSRKPHLRTWQDGWRHLRFLLLFSPRWLFLYPGLASLAFGLALTVALLPGPIAIAPGVHLDVHSVVIGCLAMLVGAQAVCFALIARKYAALRGFLPVRRDARRLLERVTLENGLVLAAVLLVGGLIGLGYCINVWRAADFGPLQYGQLIRTLSVSATTVALALQVGFSAFLAGILEIRFGELPQPIELGEP